MASCAHTDAASAPQEGAGAGRTAGSAERARLSSRRRVERPDGRALDPGFGRSNAPQPLFAAVFGLMRFAGLPPNALERVAASLRVSDLVALAGCSRELCGAMRTSLRRARIAKRVARRWQGSREVVRRALLLAERMNDGVFDVAADRSGARVMAWSQPEWWEDFSCKMIVWSHRRMPIGDVTIAVFFSPRLKTARILGLQLAPPPNHPWWAASRALTHAVHDTFMTHGFSVMS